MQCVDRIRDAAIVRILPCLQHHHMEEDMHQLDKESNAVDVSKIGHNG